MSNQRHILLILIKVLAMILLLILLSVAGAVIGYSVIGGDNSFKVFQPSL